MGAGDMLVVWRLLARAIVIINHAHARHTACPAAPCPHAPIPPPPLHQPPPTTNRPTYTRMRPNRYDGDDRVVTKRRVAAGEELTYDYGLTETEASMHAGMACLCGSAHCRGVLGFSEYRCVRGCVGGCVGGCMGACAANGGRAA